MAVLPSSYFASVLVDSIYGRIHADQLPLLDAKAARLGLPTSPAYQPTALDLRRRELRLQLLAQGLCESDIRLAVARLA